MGGLVKVNRKQVTYMEQGEVTAEASSLGLTPGDWPDFIAVVDERDEGFLFGPGIMFMHGDEVGGYEYQNVNGLKLTVFND